MLKQNNTQTIHHFLVYAVIANLLFTVFTFVLNTKSDTKMVYVDAIKLVSKYKGMDDAKRKLTEKTNAWKTNIDSLGAELERVAKEYERIRKTLTDKEKSLMEELINVKQQQYLSYEQTVRDLYQKSDQELSQEILQRVNDYIKRYGEQKGYTIIFASTHYGNIAYAQDALNITDELLEGLNQEYINLN